MKINPRSISRQIVELSKSFPCIMLTGARQTGKSTLLKSMLPEGMGYVSLDDFRAVDEAKTDPIGFLEERGTPLCIDEIQYAPELLRAIKLKVDAEPARMGMYWLTGSQRYRMMQGVAESLAGRVAILEMHTYSQAEAEGCGMEAKIFTPDAAALRANANTSRNCTITDLYKRIWKGGYPALYSRPELKNAAYFTAYLQTYLERDVRTLTQVGDLNAFGRLMVSAASRTGQQLVYSDIARDAEISVNTAKHWISILEAGGIVHLLQPYHTNTSKRLTKTPKLYFMDTGLCCALCGWNTAEVLQNGAMNGAILETWVYGQLYRSFSNEGLLPNISYYRTGNGAEIDFILEQNGCIYPIEVKRSSSPKLSDLRAANNIPTGKNELKPGIVLCTAPELIHLGKGNYGFPISAL